jgi:ubiquitin C-terminal hydrolase
VKSYKSKTISDPSDSAIMMAIKQCGMTNTGSTCWFNSTRQALYASGTARTLMEKSSTAQNPVLLDVEKGSSGELLLRAEDAVLSIWHFMNRQRETRTQVPLKLIDKH